MIKMRQSVYKAVLTHSVPGTNVNPKYICPGFFVFKAPAEIYYQVGFVHYELKQIKKAYSYFSNCIQRGLILDKAII